MLKSMIENGKPPLQSRFILLMCRLMKPFTPKVSSSERWPLEELVVNR
ncbi:MAG: hypothetical protein M2R45_01481 [Verrucomicrobia subdivision 3 bacterium]|nr:hypothetical protein [Limisphaerales bacterium]MCS1413389.1 hypothetical protein [Limisphaerales bacterium]